MALFKSAAKLKEVLNWKTYIQIRRKMDRQECKTTYEQLEKLLSEVKLEWVKGQVAEAIREGKSVEKRFSKTKTITVKEEYTLEEQLLLLIDAIEQAVVNVVEIEAEISLFLKEENNNNLEPLIVFYPAENESRETFKFSPHDFFTQSMEVAGLRKLLIALREEVAGDEQELSHPRY